MRVTLQAGPYLRAFGLVAGATAVASVVVWLVPLDSISAIYMLPVLVSAVRLGTGPAIFAALLGAFVTSLFYHPLFSPLVFKPAQITDLVASLFVALTVGPLAGRLRAQMGLSRILEERRLRQRTDALRDILVESVSHELRTPLAGIMGAASVLATAPELSGDTPLAGLASSIEQEARRLDRLIQEVLDLGRIRAGALQPRLDTVDPCDIVEAAVRAAADRLRGHVVRNVLDPSLPLVRVDPTLVSQALVNILENAAKYTEAGQVIDIAAEEHDGTLAIIVRDRGPGLAAGEADLIFERFRRGSRHADVVGGSGLGLTIARVFVEACGGRVVAQSDGLGQGTVFRLILRIAEAGHSEHDED